MTTSGVIAMIYRYVWALLSIKVVFALVIAGYPLQAITSNDIRSNRYTSVDAQQQTQPLEQFRHILLENLQQYIGNKDQDKAPGIAVGLVTEQGDLAFGLGQRKIGKHLNVDANTMFGIGSVSKLFVGMALAKAVVDGELTDTTLANDWLDRSLQIDNRITFGHLVTHYSGLPNFPGNIYTRPNAPNNPFLRQLMPAKDYNKENLANCLRQNECLPNTPPGSQHGYSNLGIGILSIALENRYGYQNADDLIRTTIIEKLNMGRTSMNTPEFLVRYRGDLSQGYFYQESTNKFVPVPQSDMGIFAGSGELISSVNDMNCFLKVLTGLESGLLKRVAEEINRPLKVMNQEPLVVGYAHQIIRKPDGSKLHWKGGGTAGYTAIVLWQTEPKVGLVILSNRNKMDALKATGKRLFSQIVYHQQQLNLR
jgi:CubicO group peptidase (beta-lactamase class C family)